MKRFFLILSFFLALSSTCLAYSDQIHDIFLPNGLKVIMMEKKKSPHVAVDIFYNVGSHDDPTGKKGMSYVFTELMYRGSKRWSREDRRKMLTKVQSDYGNVFSRDLFNVYDKVHRDDIELVFDYQADRMENLNINEETLASAKESIRAEFEKIKHKQLTVLGDSLGVVIYPDAHPYRSTRLGSLTHIEAITVEDCKQFYKNYFSPNNATIVVVGDIDPENITRLVFKHFGSIKPSDSIPLDPDLSVDFSDKFNEIQRLQDSFKSFPLFLNVSGAMFMLPTSRHKDVLALMHVWNIIGYDLDAKGAFYKKFYKDTGLGVNVRYFSGSELGRSVVSLWVANVFKEANMKDVEKAMFDALDMVANEGISQAHIDNYRKKKLLDYYNYDIGDIAYTIGHAEVVYGDYGRYQESINILKELTKEDIKQLVKKYLKKENAIMVSVNHNERGWFNFIPNIVLNWLVFPIFGFAFE